MFVSSQSVGPKMCLHFAVEIGSFECLRVLMVTGAVFTAPGFEWANEAFGKRAHILSTSGGTDICGGCEDFQSFFALDPI